MDKYLESIINKNISPQIYISNKAKNKDINIDNAHISYKNLFRLPTNYHQKYKVVWAIEDDFAFHKNWKHELDEMIRLIGKEGKLIIKCSSSLTHNMYFVKNFLYRRLGIEVSVEWEKPLTAQKIYKNEKWTKEDYETITVFNVKRKNLEIYKDKLWTFSILTTGNKVDEIQKFCSSIRNIDKTNKHQILIHGPKNKKYDKYKVDYVEVNRNYREQYSEISAKKNDIIDCAKNQNLLICHDRYYINDSFFEGFNQYGYDFDILSVDTSFSQNDVWFPHYVKMFNFIHDFEWNKERYCFKHNDFAKNNVLDNIFINGGLMIFKRDIVKQIRFNECLFHQQIEDVEMSKEFAKYSLLPRANLLSKVTTTKDIDGKIGKDLSYIDRYISVGGKIIQKKKINLYKRIRKILLKGFYKLITNKKLINFLEKRIFK